MMRKARGALVALLFVVTAGGMAHASPTVLNPPTLQPVCSHYPVFINNPGSYVLGANFVVPCDKTAIEIRTDNVTLDLDGFSIIGVGGPGSGVGISAQTHSNITVKNGSVLKMPGGGIALGANANVADVTSSGSNGQGIEFSSGTIRRVHSDGNGGVGILADSSTNSSTIADSEASGNVGPGINAGPAIISGNTAKSNGGSDAIGCTADCSVLGNVVQDNLSVGIFCDGVCTIANNTSTGNADEGIFSTGQITNNTVSDNQGDGIHMFGPTSSAVTNSVGGNTLFGIKADSALSSFGNNQISLNNGETDATPKTKPQTSGGVQISPNICDGNTTCP